MRIRLKKGKQKELIALFLKSNNLSLSSLARNLNKSMPTVYYWYSEKNLLPLNVYKILDRKKEFKKDILEYKNLNWGQSKGGKLSSGNLIKIKNPKFGTKLAEFLGIMFGDGNSYSNSLEDNGVYVIRIAGHSINDREYLENFVMKLVKDLFGLNGKTYLFKDKKAMHLIFYSKKLVDKLKDLGFPPGNKIKNKLKIPNWIKSKKSYAKAFIRGLIDTDGSIFRMSNQDPKLLRINFTNFIPDLLTEVRNILSELGFHPSKITSNGKIYLSRKSNISLYLKEIGFSNKKHINRLRNLKNGSPLGSPIV